MGDEEDDEYYSYNQKQKQKQNNKRNKKKQQQQQPETQSWDWDDIYDPTRPNNYSDYKGSDEQYREHRDWKARLYYYQLKDAKKAKKIEDAPRMPANSECSISTFNCPPDLCQACSLHQQVSASHHRASTTTLLHSAWKSTTMTSIIRPSQDQRMDQAAMLPSRLLHSLRPRCLTMLLGMMPTYEGCA